MEKQKYMQLWSDYFNNRKIEELKIKDNLHLMF